MTKIICISTSPRKKGNTMLAMEEMAKTIQENGGESEIYSLAGKTIASCRACNACNKTGKCAIDDGVNEMAEIIKNADGMIIGAPVYFGTARGDCMNFLQRLGMINLSNQRFLDGKVCGPIAVARRGGHTATLSEMLMFFFINGMIVPGAKYWNMGFGRLPGEVAEDIEGVENFKSFAANVLKVAKQMKK